MAFKSLLGIAFVSLATACASTAAPQGQLAASQAAIRAANELGAGSVPKAALHLQMAREGTEKAEKLMAQKENEAAQFVLMRAEADAELALALAKEASAQKDAQAAMDKVKDVKAKVAE
jgi:hypothetical protein